MSDSNGAQALRERSDAGFTLVELLAAIALLSLVSAILLGSLQLGLKAWERGTAYAQRIDDVALVQNFLRRAIEDAYPYFAAEAGTTGHVEFEGTATSLRFLSSAAQALSTGGRSRLSITAAQGRQGFDLVVMAAPKLASDSSSKKILLANLQSVEMSYFGRGRSNREAMWRTQWIREPRLPQLVRIQVSFPPGDARPWPELVIAPRIGADVGCVYDLLTKRCRGR